MNNLKVAFVGRPGLGGTEMRSRCIAEALGVPFLPVAKIDESHRGKWDTIVLCKYWDHREHEIRAACDRLIYDPLDVWEGLRMSDFSPREFWAYTYHKLEYDAIVSTSPACTEAMASGLYPDVSVIREIPHHADPRISSDWFDLYGPMVYAGGERFVKDALPEIRTFAKLMGKDLLVRCDRECWAGLRGASSAYVGRHGKSRTALSIACKPAVKVENAIAAGLYLFFHEEPAIQSLLESRGVRHGKIHGSIYSADRYHKPITLADSVAAFRSLIYGDQG